MIRKPVAAGAFYPASSDALRGQIASMANKNINPEKAFGVVSPHAGYQFSGPITCEVFSKVRITDTVIILGPNHTGMGKPFALYADGSWRTSFGDISIDRDISTALLKKTDLFEEDMIAHADEHSLEVQVPVMQYFNPDFKIVPIVIGITQLKKCLEAAEAISAVIKESGKDVLIVASSDMTHYESQSDANRKDKIAIDAILKLDESLLFKSVEKYNITMCGYIPTVIMIAAVKALGAASARLVRYQTSGDITGDYSQVVGYAGIIVE